MNKAMALFTLSLSVMSTTQANQEPEKASPAESPLIQPLAETAWNDKQKQLFDFLKSTDPDAKKPQNMLQTIAHHQKLLDVFMPMASQLGATTTMPRRELELLALRTAWRAQSEYEWVHHYDYGLEAGLSEAEMASLLQESPEWPWSDSDLLLIRTADELVKGTQVSAETMRDLIAQYNSEEIIEIIFLVNQYNSLSKFANSLSIELESGYSE